MGRGNRQLKRFTSWLVLVSFMASLMAPVVEGAALIPLKVPGRHVLFDVNSATVSELASIPGIGAKTAAEIVRHRTQFGPFKTIQDVGVVPGVGKARLAKLTGAATQGSRSDLRLRTQTAAPKVTEPVVRQTTPVKTVSSAVEGLAKTLQPVWVTGSNGVKVNVNIPDTKTLVSNLSRAGFSDVQVNTIANTRLMSDPSGTRLSFKPVTGITDLQARLGTAGLKGVIDSTGTLVSRQPAVQPAPAAPQSASKAVPGVGGKGLVYATGDRLMFRFDGNGKPVTVNLNQQSATGLFKQLRDAGVPSGTAKAVAQARMKGSFQSFQDLAARVPSVETVAKAPATRSSISAPVEAPKAPAPVAPPAPSVHDVELARLTKQHQAIANRTPSSVTGYDRTLKSLQDTYDGMFKSLAKKASAANPGVSADSVAKDPRLQGIARDIDVYNKGKANLVKAETLNKAKVAVDAEIAKYSKQAEAVQARKPTSAKGFDTTVDSLKATYRDLYNRLEMKARLEGKVSADSIVKDPRLQKLAESIDSVRTAKNDFQTQKAANVEQARVNAEKAAARKAKVAASETAPAAPETPAAKTEPKAPSKPAASQPEVVSAPKPAAEAAARIETLSAKTKSLFSEIRAESGGRFTSNKDVWEAARHYRGEGKLAELRKTASELQQLRNARLNQATAEAPAAPAAEKPVAKAKPAAEPVAGEQLAKSKSTPVQETVAPVEQTAPAKAMTETQLLSQQAKDLTARLVKEGRFTNAREVYQASETGGAKGELAQLKSINDKIRANRAANKPAAPAAETAPTGTKSATAEPVAAVEPTPAKAKVAASETGVAAAPAAETAAPKGKWTDGFLKALKGGQYKSTEGGWADGYLKMLKGDGSHVTGQPVEPAPVEGLGRASETAGATKPAPSGGWADQYLNTLKGEGAQATAPAGEKGGWFKRLFSRKTASGSAPAAEVPLTEQPVAEIPMTKEPLASETAGAGTPAKPVEVGAQIKDLQGQAYSLKQKIKATGKFANNAEIFKASEASGASGDLAQLKSINDQIRSLRVSKKAVATQAPATEAPTPGKAGTSPAAPAPETAPAPLPEQVAAPKQGGFWQGVKDWFTGKNTLAGRAKAAAQTEAQAKGTAPAETVVASETPVAGETPAAAPKKGGFWSGLKDWFTGKNTLAGKARAAAAEAKAQAAAETLPTAETPVETKASQTAKTGPASETAPAPKGTVVEPTAPIAEIPAEPAVAKSPQVQKIEAINSEIASLRTRAHDLSSGLVKEGTFKNAGEAYRASEQSGASGKLAELHQVNENIRSLRTEKTGLAKPSSAPAAEPTPAGAPAAAETPAAGGAGNAAVSKALPPVLEAANANGFSVKFGQKTHDLGAMTAKQIEAETGGLISNENAQKIAETAKANGGKISVNDLSKLGLTDDAVSALRKGNTDAVAGQLQEARAKAVERFGAESEAVKKIDSSLEQLKQSQPAKSETAPAAPSKGMTELLSARTTQLDSVNAQIAKLESSTGLLAKFTKGKQLKALYEQKATLEKEIAGYKQDPQALETANKAYQQKHEKVFAEQAKQAGYLEVELAKVDPNSRYGRALQERINQIKGMPPESFAKQASNMFLIAAGTNIMLSLGRQLMNGEKPDLGAAIKGIATPQFLLGTAGAAIGAYAGSKFALSKMGLILTTKLGSFLPPVGRVFLQMLPAMAGGALGSTLLSGGFKEADWLQIGAETIGSTLGAALAMSLFPGMGIFGQISAGMMGAEAAKFILKMIRGDPKSETAEGGGQAGEPQVPGAEGAAAKASATVASFTEKDVEDTFNAMGIFYQRYLDSEKSGNYGDAAQYYEKYAALKARLDGMRNSSFQARAK